MLQTNFTTNHNTITFYVQPKGHPDLTWRTINATSKQHAAKIATEQDKSWRDRSEWGSYVVLTEAEYGGRQ